MLYKGYKSSVNYDGEPSVSNGIVYQLPSSHLLIHRVPAKLSNRVIALRSELLQATALVYILILLTCPFRRVRIFRGRFPCFVTCWSLCWCSACCTPSLSGFFPEPCPISESSATRQGSGINNAVDCLMLQSLPSFRPPDVHQHLLRIIDRSLLQNRINDSQKLAGYHNQWLHLFSGLSGRVV